MPQARVTILGAGAMGTAMSSVFAENKFAVTLWDVEKEVVQDIRRKHKNPRSLSSYKLDKSITAETDIHTAVANADIVVFAVASKAVREVAQTVADSLSRNCVVISVVKGLAHETHETMYHVLKQELGATFHNQLVLFSGPTLATGLIEKKPTAAMLASEKANAYTKRAYDALKTDWLHITETRDVIGVSLAGVAKNALAVGSGMIMGLGLHMNTYGWVMTESFREMSRLIWKLGGQAETMFGLAGFGDMFMTCTSEESRNRSFGVLLGKGKTVTRALDTVKETVEGIDAIEALYFLAQKEKLKLPVLQTLHEVVGLKKNMKKSFEKLVKEL